MPPDPIAPALAPELFAELTPNFQPGRPLPAAPPPAIQAQLQGLSALRQTVVLWLIALGLAGFTLTLVLVTTTLQDEVAQTDAELQSIQLTVARLGTPSAEVVDLTATLTQTLALAAELDAARPGLGVDWPAVMGQVGNYNSTQLLLTDLIQENNRVTLNGAAVDSAFVTQYRAALEASTLFTRVVIQSIKVIAPTPVPTAGRANGTATPAPFPVVNPTAGMTVAFVIIMELKVQP